MSIAKRVALVIITTLLTFGLVTTPANAQAATPAPAVTGMVASDPVDDAFDEAAWLLATMGGCGSMTATTIATMSPLAAVAAAGSCGIGIGRYLGKANVIAICWSSRQWWGGYYRYQVRLITRGQYSRC